MSDESFGVAARNLYLVSHLQVDFIFCSEDIDR